MTVLARTEILKLVKSGKLKIKPFNERQVGPASIDMRLDNVFRVFNKTHKIFMVRDKVDHKKLTKIVKVGKGGYFLIMPGELIHGITKEEIELPENICARIEGRSSLARIGLLVHLSSGFIHPGTKNKTVLEIVNISHIPLAIYPGIRICQIILEDVKGKGVYRGKFHLQKEP